MAAEMAENQTVLATAIAWLGHRFLTAGSTKAEAESLGL